MTQDPITVDEKTPLEELVRLRTTSSGFQWRNAKGIVTRESIASRCQHRS
jgi:hypothetical protein